MDDLLRLPLPPRSLQSREVADESFPLPGAITPLTPLLRTQMPSPVGAPASKLSLLAVATALRHGKRQLGE